MRRRKLDRALFAAPVASTLIPLLFVSASCAFAGSHNVSASFEQAVQPVLKQTCAMCHNEKLASGGLDITAFLDQASVIEKREGWQRILSKVHTGEMPPKGVPRPSAERLQAFEAYVQDSFDRVDRAAKPDPGHVTARRLNRAEYANTVRDLLGVHFSADEEFPPDDSGYGFDNIGDVLTVSPVLLQKYLAAAEKIAARAIGADPLPKPGLFNKKSKILRKDLDTVEFTDRVEFDADYIVSAEIAGHRGPQGKPVTLVISVDGKPLKTVEVPSARTEVTRLAGSTQRVSEPVRVFLTEGPHLFRAQFINDDFFKDEKDIRPASHLNSNKNIFTETMQISGPFAPKERPENKLLVCNPELGSACFEKILTPLAHRAFRREATKVEVASLLKIAESARSAGYTPGQSLQFALAALLVSPNFLFRIEHDPPPGKADRISDLELASRLSYFLWSSMPDDELLRLAETGKLRRTAILDLQVKRMLADPKSAALADNFAGQWLEIRSLDAVKPDPKKFPDWGVELKEAMRTETRMFFENVMREDRPITDFLDGNYTFLNEQLAKHYAIAGVTGPEFRKVELAGDQRGGVLTQGSVLTVSSYPSRTSVVLRGKFVLENFLGAAPPPPPPDIPALDEAAVGASRSLRQQMEKHRSNAACASCHARMDVLGFGLENYDAIGQWRVQDGKFPIDPSGTFPNGKSFTTPAEMKAVLRSNLPEFTHTLVEKMFIYSLGRAVQPYDRLAIQAIERHTAESGYRFQTLISGIVHSFPFQARRGELPITQKTLPNKTAKPIQEIARK